MRWGPDWAQVLAATWVELLLTWVIKPVVGLASAGLAGWLGRRFWKRLAKPRLERRKHRQIKEDRARWRQLLSDSMRRVWTGTDGYLARALDSIAHLPVILKVPDGVLRDRGGDDELAELAEIWRRSDRRKLRLIGGWGTGKTVHLLRLAKALLNDLAPERDEPVPVVVNVSSWTAKAGTFDWWLLDEIVRRHGLPRSAIEDLYDRGQLVLLLDGVDEHPRPQECAAAIGALLNKTPELQIVVTYRTGYDLPSRQRQQWIDQHLADLLDPIEIKPLSAGQVTALLDEADDRWAAVRQLIDSHPDLWDPLIHRPMVLATLMRALRGRRTELSLIDGSQNGPLADLYDLYIDTVITDRINAAGDPKGQPHSVKQGRSALAWLADTAARCDLGTTLYLAEMSVCWLPSWTAKRRATRVGPIVFGVVGGLVFGLLYGSALLIESRVAADVLPEPPLIDGMDGVLHLMLSLMLVGGVAGALGLGRLGRLVGRGWLAGLERPLVGRMVWSWTPWRLVTALSVTLVTGWWLRLTEWWQVDRGVFILVALGLVVGFAVVFGLRGEPPTLGRESYPRLLRRSTLLYLMRGLLGGLGFGLAAGTPINYWPYIGLAVALSQGFLPVSIGLAVGLIHGLPPWLRYWTIHRQLRRAGLFPGRKLTDFFDWCTSHNGPLLLPAGYGYRFLHPTFQEHLAAAWHPPTAPPDWRDVSRSVLYPPDLGDGGRDPPDLDGGR